MSRLIITGLMLAAAFPFAVLTGIADAAFFGAEHGANSTRFMLGLAIGLIIGTRHIAPQRAAHTPEER